MPNSQPKTFLNITLTLLTALLFLAPCRLFAQQTYGTLKGKVVAANNQPAADISIGLTGTGFGTNTNSQGEFAFKAAPGSYTLIISYVGVQTVEVPVTVTANETVNVPLITVNARMAQLSEVNVIASRANRFARTISTDVGKIPLNNLENAQSYTTVTTELLKEQQIFSVDDALRNAPGLQKMWDATGCVGVGGGYFTLHGFVTQTRLRDGVAGLVTSGIDAVNIDKIEVIKGPSATLFGSTLTSFGGLVNRVTKKPYDTLGIEIGQAGGNYDLSRTSLDFNTPLTKDKSVLVRLNSAYNYQGSFQNYGLSRSFALAPSLSIKASERLSFLAQAEMFFGRNSAKPFFFFWSSPKDMGVSKVSDFNINYYNAYSNDNITQYSRSMNYFAQAKYKISDKFTSQTIFSSSNSYSNGPSPYYYLVTDAVAGAYGVPDIAGGGGGGRRRGRAASHS